MTNINDTKVCSKCYEEKTLDCFHAKPKGKFGVHSICKICRYKQSIKWVEKNKERSKEIQRNAKRRSRATPDGKYKQYLINLKYVKNNKEKVNAYYSNRKKLDSIYKMKCKYRAIVTKAFKRKGYTKRSKSNAILGCTWEQLVIYIGNQFTEGMSWDLVGNEIHIDHIIPLSTAKTEEDVIRLNHYTNLQPLWAEDNLRKSDRLDWKP